QAAPVLLLDGKRIDAIAGMNEARRGVGRRQLAAALANAPGERAGPFPDQVRNVVRSHCRADRAEDQDGAEDRARRHGTSRVSKADSHPQPGLTLAVPRFSVRNGDSAPRYCPGWDLSRRSRDTSVLPDASAKEPLRRGEVRVPWRLRGGWRRRSRVPLVY